MVEARWNGAVIRAPFHVDYGKNLQFGPGCFVNYGCFFMDICEIRIGARCQFGTAVQLLTEDRPRDVARRSKGQEWGRPISIGDDVFERSIASQLETLTAATA